MTQAQYRTTINSTGRIYIPTELRAALDMEIGDELILILVNGAIQILSRKEAVMRAQALVRKYVPEGVSLVDELIADRREEASGE